MMPTRLFSFSLHAVRITFSCILFTALLTKAQAQAVENLVFVEESQNELAEFLNGVSIGDWVYRGNPTYPGAPAAAAYFDDQSPYGGITIPYYGNAYLADPGYPGSYVSIEGVNPNFGGEFYTDDPLFETASNPGWYQDLGSSELPYSQSLATVITAEGNTPVDISVVSDFATTVPEPTAYSVIAGMGLLALALSRQVFAGRLGIRL